MTQLMALKEKKTNQHAKKVVSNSPGLVDFTVGLADSDQLHDE